MTRWTWSSADQVTAGMARIADAGFNTVYFQVRGTFDAYYASPLEPWAAGLTGTLGRDPGWDPLQTALDAARTHDLAVHAWLNTFPMWRGTTPPGPGHAWTDHPDWRLQQADGSDMDLNASYVFADPQDPAVRSHIAEVTRTLTAAYDVDGVHLDYVRYPGASYGPGDSDTKRAAVVQTVQAVQDAVDVPVSAAVWGLHTNTWGWDRVSQGHVDFLQDSHALMERGVLDASLPMIYWPVNPGGRLDFDTLTRDHLAHAGGGAVYPGISAEALSTDQVEACITAARAAGAPGFVIFDWTNIRDDGDRIRAFMEAED